MTNPTPQSVLFPELFDRPTTAIFDGQAQTSDGGAGLLGAVDRRLGLTDSLASCFVDRRARSRIQHSFEEILRQRVFSIALGYCDQNDAARVGHDPMLKALSGRAPIKGADLASQPTLSRFENSVTAPEVLAMSRELEASVVARLSKRHRNARRITIDMDPSVDPTHGNQQGTLFNAFYDTWCYLPCFGTLIVDGDPEQYLFCARLRPGNAAACRSALRTIRRMVKRLRAAFPRAEIRVRLDSGFASPQVFDALDELRVKYVVGMPKTARLLKLCEVELVAAGVLALTGEKTAQVYGEFQYAAGSWKHKRRIIFKAQVLVADGKLNKDNPRFVVTNISRSYKAETIYRKIYCARGDAENRLKELKRGLSVDRTSCTSFLANQFRVLMTAAAYVLFQELRYALRGTEAARWQVTTLRERLLKIGARVVASVRRIVLHLAGACPWRDLWCEAARRLGAAPG